MIEAALRDRPDVRLVEANRATRRVLVLTTPAVAPAEIQLAIERVLAVAGPAEQTGPAVTLPYRSDLARVVRVAIPDRTTLAMPATLTVSAHGLYMLQNLALVTSVTVAAGGQTRILRRLGVTSTRSQLRVLAAASAVFTLGEVWTQHQRSRKWQAVSLAAEERVRTATFEQLLDQDLVFFDQHGTGSMISSLTDQVGHIGAFVSGGDQVVESAMMIVLGFFALLRTSPRLALVAAAAVPIGFVPTRLLGDRTERAFRRAVDPSANLTTGLENLLTGVVEVKSFTAERREAIRVATLSARLRAAMADATDAAFLQNSVVRNVLYSAAAVMFWLGARQVLQKKVVVAKLTRAIYWIPQLIGAIGAAAQLAGTYYAARAAAGRLSTVLTATPSIQSGGLHHDSSILGAIAVEHVTFGYSPDRPVLRDISFQLPAGTTLGIVGPTGSGKSTLLKLLLRFYEPDRGRIMLDGWDIREFDVDSLRAAIALVSQEVYLFDDTLAENVAYGRPGASADELAGALSGAAANDVVHALPNGLQAQLGERGHRLSGGQRQRIALARALLKDAPILALDEATSHLDYASEAAIKESLSALNRQKTIVLIAHRLSSVRHADNIIVLDGGAISEQGNHDSLLEQRGLYYRLWQLQS